MTNGRNKYDRRWSVCHYGGGDRRSGLRPEPSLPMIDADDQVCLHVSPL